MTIKVRELLERPDLSTRLIAGASGIERAVTWAHVCELEDPTAWLCGGELVMTVGLGIPPDPAGQIAYIERLARAGLAGLMICEGMKAPPLSAEMLATADRLGFPVMLTAFEVPFVAVSRAAADANLAEQHARLHQAVGVYDVARLAVRGELEDRELIGRLERIVGAHLVVCDVILGQVILPGTRHEDEAFLRPLQQVLERYSPNQLPAVLQLGEIASGAIALAVPARRQVFLVVLPRRNRGSRDVVTLRHVATVLALALERRQAERERRFYLGSELFAQLAERRLPPDLALELVQREQALPAPPYVLAAIPEGAVEQCLLQDYLSRRDFRHAVYRRDGILYMLLPDNEEVLRILRQATQGAPVGLSQQTRTLARIPEALVEARWALEQARRGEVVRYDERALGVGGWPINIDMAREFVESVLGPLLRYDARQGGQLVPTLAAFLELDGAWSETARFLGIHRQTLVYRLRKVEELTGLRVNRVSDLATLWLALRTAQMLGIVTLREAASQSPHVSPPGGLLVGRKR